MTYQTDYAFTALDPNSAYIQYGLTKREYMATKLMAAMMSHDNEAWAGVTYDQYAHEAVKATDSLIKRLNSEEES